jgi:hypothetical protein
MRRPWQKLMTAVAAVTEEEWKAMGYTVAGIATACIATTLAGGCVQDSITAPEAPLSPMALPEIAAFGVATAAMFTKARDHMSAVWSSSAEPVEAAAPARRQRPIGQIARAGIAALANTLRPGFPPSTSGVAAAPSRD